MKRPNTDAAPQEQPKMKIFLKMMKTLALDVNSCDRVQDIKAKVCAIEGFGVTQQELFFAGNHLEDAKSLADYNIPTNSTINLILGDGMQIFIKIPPSGRTTMLEVKNLDTIRNVKMKIQDKEGIPPDRQALLYLDQSLDDNKTLSAYGIRKDSILQMVLRPIDELHIYVTKVRGKTIKLNVRSWFTIRDVKMMIENMEKVMANQMNLVYAERDLQDSLTLSECEVRDQAVLYLQVQMQILVKTWMGKTLTLSVCNNDTVAVAMKKIDEKMGFTDINYMLIYAGKVLSVSENRTLADYHIESGSTINLHLRVTVETFCVCVVIMDTGRPKTIYIVVKPHVTVGEVKAIIQEQMGMRVREPKLSAQGVELKVDNRPLVEYDVGCGSKLHFTYRA